MPNVYLFGAGASCAYVPLPPGSVNLDGFINRFFLDADFFDFVDSMWQGFCRGGQTLPEHYDGADWSWLELEQLLIDTCGPGFRALGMERTYSEIWQLGVPQELHYLRCIELTLFWQLRGVAAANLGTHVEFVNRLVRPGDSLVTFNYDPFLEHALMLGASVPGSELSWHERDGYGLPLESVESQPQHVEAAASNVRVLKLHGSIDWLHGVGQRPSPPFRPLRAFGRTIRGQGFRVYRHAGLPLRPVIVPPLPEKDYEQLGLADVWRLAEEALVAADSLTVVGYSFPSTDAQSIKLLERVAASHGGKLPATFVTLKADAAFERFRKVFPDARLVEGGFSVLAGGK
ncbi:MAG: SIR2 family protein [Candidatus Eisenbacteria bacterium]|nr:SIR2 family protein [Candidatus Eisenbacteria bacterium]